MGSCHFYNQNSKKCVNRTIWCFITLQFDDKNWIILGPPEWREYVSGWGAAVANIFVTFPINKTMFRQMVHGFSTFEAMKQLKREGALHLYRGILPPLLQKSSSTAIMFGTYSQYNRLMTNFLGIRNNNQVKKKIRENATIRRSLAECHFELTRNMENNFSEKKKDSCLAVLHFNLTRFFFL